MATDTAGAIAASNSVTVTVSERVNVALAAHGATVTASSTLNGEYLADNVINGDRRGAGWGPGTGWNDQTPNTWPDWLEIAFDGAKQIDEVAVFSVQDNWVDPIEPTPGLTFSLYGLRDVEVQYWTGSAWQAIPGAAVTDNTLVWRAFTFTPVTTTKIRLWVTAALATWTRVIEVEAYGYPAAEAEMPLAAGAAAAARAPAGVPVSWAADGEAVVSPSSESADIEVTDAEPPASRPDPPVPVLTYYHTCSCFVPTRWRLSVSGVSGDCDRSDSERIRDRRWTESLSLRHSKLLKTNHLLSVLDRAGPNITIRVIIVAAYLCLAANSERLANASV